MGRSRRYECRDRLSELPDSLIHLVFSFLPTRDVVSSTLLSKRYHHLWTTTPFLHFRDLPSRDFVCGVLARWKGLKILNFTLGFRFHPSHFSDLDSWLHFAIEKQVEELCLHLVEDEGYGSQFYAPHQRLYSCSSITKLSLYSVKLNVCERVRWNQLKSLSIERAGFLSEHAMNHILSGSPLLEVLNFVGSSDNLNVRSTSLKMLKIERYICQRHNDDGAKDTSLVICAPNLETLEINGVPFTRCSLKVPSVTNAILGFHGRVLFEEMLRQVLLDIHHVEKVTLSDWSVKVLLSLKKKGKVVPVSNATFLKLFTGAADEMFGVLETFPKVVVLIFELKNASGQLLHHSLFGFWDDVVEEEDPVVEFDANTLSSSLPHLRTVDVSWLLHDTSIYPVIEILLKNGLMLEKMVFRPICFDPELVCVAAQKLLIMQRSSPSAVVIISKYKSAEYKQTFPFCF